MGSFHAAPTLRPFLLADAPRLAVLFRESIEALTEDFYDEGQRAAWAARADDEAAFTAKLAKALTIVALVGGEIAGFASLKDNTLFDMLYVHPDFARRGVGSALLDAIGKARRARNEKTYRRGLRRRAQFFARRGYTAQSRNTVELDGEWLGRTRMTKELVKPEVDPRLAAPTGRPQ
ncbi:N-acetyltransferase family protein [Methylocystis parvus]|uniref:GNAT family N-acetyltransferase n=1 Tax=Methylocystis parvus TaxID=134 RepID=UPI003C7763C2